MKHYLVHCRWVELVHGITGDIGRRAADSLREYDMEVVADDVIEAKHLAARAAEQPPDLFYPDLEVTVVSCEGELI